MNKRAFDFLTENIIFLLLIIVFFAIMFYFVGRAESQSSLVEQIYAKQIALLIDKAKPGEIINLNIEEISDAARKNKFNGRIVSIDNLNKKVSVHVVSGKGYNFDFFNNANIIWDIKDNGNILYMEIR